MFESKRNRTCPPQKGPSASRVLRNLKNHEAALIVAPSEGDANMLYAVGFFVPDPFIFLQHKNTKYAVMSDLEIDRAKKQAHVDRVLSLPSYQKKLRKLGKSPATMVDILDLLFRERGIRSPARAGELFRVARRSIASARATTCTSSATRSGTSAKRRTTAK